MAVKPVGTVGACVSGDAVVLADVAALCAEQLSQASQAEIVYVYKVEAASPPSI